MKDIIEKLGMKKLGLAVGFLVLIIVILIGGSLIYNKFFYKRSFSEIESIMLEATKKYTSQNKNILPKEINETITLSTNELVKAEQMKDISEYLKDDSITCTGNITITNINNTYRYVPILDCGNDYETVKFVDYLKNENPIVEAGNGLYNMNEELVFRGDTLNNYLKLSDKLYRIVKITNDSPVVIFSEKGDKIQWDNRYNTSKQSTIGINDYSVSIIRDYLTSMYKNGTIFTSDSDKNLVIAHNLNIGKRSSKDTDKSGQYEKSAIIEKQFIGLLPLYDYLNASLDSECTTSVSANCMNYNFLANYRNAWWTMTSTSLNTYNVFQIENYALLKNGNSSAVPRYVLHLAKDALYVSGDGTKTNPYIIK